MSELPIEVTVTSTFIKGWALSAVRHHDHGPTRPPCHFLCRPRLFHLSVKTGKNLLISLL